MPEGPRDAWRTHLAREPLEVVLLQHRNARTGIGRTHGDEGQCPARDLPAAGPRTVGTLVRSRKFDLVAVDRDMSMTGEAASHDGVARLADDQGDVVAGSYEGGPPPLQLVRRRVGGQRGRGFCGRRRRRPGTRWGRGGTTAGLDQDQKRHSTDAGDRGRWADHQARSVSYESLGNSGV